MIFKEGKVLIRYLVIVGYLNSYMCKNIEKGEWKEFFDVSF